jgi:hypothetical protein
MEHFIKGSQLPDPAVVLSEWFSQEHPERLHHDCMWRDHNQYREYHKSFL